MQKSNEMQLSFMSQSENQSFARATVAAFISQLDPTIEEIEDVKTAVSEAVTNSMIHGYADKKGQVQIICSYIGNQVTITISDKGEGIKNIEKAREPLYTSKPELERSGMGFTMMETFMDDIKVSSKLNEGTTITMVKNIQKSN